MIKFLLKPYFFLMAMLALPLIGICQTTFPKWVDDMGGASGFCKPTGMMTDKQNNIYVAGYFNGTIDLDPSSGAKNVTSAGGDDIYIAKYTPAGALVWGFSMGNTGLDQVNNLTVDANGNPTITGQFDSSTLTAGSTTLQNAGAEDIFIIHLDTNGNVLWAKSIGGSGTDRGEEVTADAQGNLITTSIFQSSFTLGGKNITSPGGVFNALICKFDNAGNFTWDVDLGGNGDTEVYGVDADSNGNVVVSGTYTGTVDFDPLGVHHNLNNGSNTGFVAQYTSAGKLIWVNTINGNYINNGSAVAVGPTNDIYVTAAFSSAVVFNGTTTLNPQGQDTFIAKYSSTGVFQFAKDLGGNGASSFPYQIRSDAADNVYVTGYFTGTVNFNPALTPAQNVAFHGQRDFYAVKLSGTGVYQWAFGGGSATCDQSLGIEMDVNTSNDLVLAGSFCGTVDFDPSTCKADNVIAQSSSDTYLATYTQGTTANVQITAFSIPQEIAPAVIDQQKDTIFVKVAPGTDLTALTPTITVSNGGTVTPASGVSQNFTSPVVYTASGGCSPINYTVRVVAYVAKTDTTCVGSANTITGDVENPVPTDYTWQVFVGNGWVNAPGVITSADYQTSALTNPQGSSAVHQLRRHITVAGVVKFDSYYNVDVISSGTLTNNAITPPAVTSFCGTGDPGVITGSVPGGGTGVYTYQWQSSTDSVSYTNITGATSKNFDPPTQSVTTWYRVVVTSGSCTTPSISNLVKISILSPPANPAAENALVCPGSSATLSITSPQSGVNYNWYNSQAKTTLLFTGTTFVTGAITSDSTFYVDADNGVCSSSGLTSVQVTLNAVPAAPSVANASQAICSGSSATFSISGAQEGYTYNWYSSAAGGTALASGTDFITPGLTSSQTYYVEAVNNAGCISASRTPVNVSISPPPAVSAQGITICPGSTADLTATSTDESAVINWYASASGGSILFTGTTFTTPVLNADTAYYVEAVDNTTGCISATRLAVAIQILKPLSVPVVMVDATGISSVTFQWAAVAGATGYQVSTDGGKTYSSPTSGADGLTTTISGLQPGASVAILVQAIGTQPCVLSANSAPVTGSTSQDGLIYVPNAFTPNSDGRNDVAYVHSESIRIMSFYIYDQWGELIFTSTNIQNGWDGTYKGTKEPAGVYAYYVEATLTNGQKATKKGTITLLR